MHGSTTCTLKFTDCDVELSFKNGDEIGVVGYKNKQGKWAPVSG